MVEIVARADAKVMGLAHFMDGIPCKNGHVSCKRTSNGECMECARVRANNHYCANRGVTLAKRREQYRMDDDIAQAAKGRAAKRRADMPEVLKDADAKYYAANNEVIKERSRQWSAANRERKKAYNLAWNKANPEQARRHQRAHERRRRQSDPVYAMAERIGASIRQSLINGGYTKRNRVSEILGCSFDAFATHIERQFQRGMSWANRAQWHLDHIVPISSARSEDDVIRLHHFTNLRPLWAQENAAKGDKIELLV